MHKTNKPNTMTHMHSPLQNFNLTSLSGYSATISSLLAHLSNWIIVDLVHIQSSKKSAPLLIFLIFLLISLIFILSSMLTSLNHIPTLLISILTPLHFLSILLKIPHLPFNLFKIAAKLVIATSTLCDGSNSPTPTIHGSPYLTFPRPLTSF